MINHARTLLLNQSSALVYIPDLQFSEYISPNFTPILLSTELNKVYNTIFTDKATGGLLTAVRGYMNILHLEVLEAYTLSFDTRITYDKQQLVYSNVDNALLDVARINNELVSLCSDPNIVDAVFNTSNTQSNELYNIWMRSYETPVRLGAALLGFVYKLEELRTP